ncbi:uncharacterized protein LOC119956877 [Scyliorhinus canicula]|uniref:uncharacterized protein LOC119956877 n=1 Tax=Scyliorhinus canicula TaxID=7830 RepID=UPI0018F47B54|nr:uncharacterized protein LOC119956877 [Scyliorhinus canicula]
MPPPMIEKLDFYPQRQAIDIYNSFTYGDTEDKTKYQVIVAKFDDHCKSQSNEIMEQFNLQNRFHKNGETISNFVTDLRLLAQGCNYADVTESIIRDQLIYGFSNEKLRESLMLQNDLTLKTTIAKCLQQEQKNQQYLELLEKQNMEKTHHEADVRMVASPHRPPLPVAGAHKGTSAHARNPDRRDPGRTRYAHGHYPQYRPQYENRAAHARTLQMSDVTDVMTCHRCGTAHLKGQCPAQGKRCLKCSKMNHFASQCQSTANYYSTMQRHGNFKVHTVDAMDTPTPEENFSGHEEFHSWENTYGVGIINATAEPHELTTQPRYVHAIESTREWSATVQVNNSPITFKLHTGASANLMTSKDLTSIPGTHEMLPAS